MLKPDEIAQLTPEGQAVYENSSVEQKARFAEAWRRNENIRDAGPSKASGPNSLMRVVGAAGTIIFFTMLGDSGDMALPILCASLFGVSVFMWMLGAIEQRLIMINETLKANAKAD
jgi:hypothetical protein